MTGSNWTCIRRLEFDYGHRLLNHESKCAHAHGHRGVVEVECTSIELDRAGRVIDFGDVKRIVGGWIDENWDHSFLVNDEDKPMLEFLESQSQRRFAFPGEPSAENMAWFLLTKAQQLLVARNIKVTRVRFWETPNGSAEAVAR
jgi:6-pyruvoyltetrahydropterin/6-carboxytetrahydropterin synthase